MTRPYHRHRSKKKEIIWLAAILAFLFLAYELTLPPNHAGLKKEANELPAKQVSEVSVFHGDGFYFTYPKTWKLETYEWLNEDKTINFEEVALDPIRVLTKAEHKSSDALPGMITFTQSRTDLNTEVFGSANFPVVFIGKNGAIKAKIFERTYPDDAPEVPLDGRHVITYFIGASQQIEYVDDAKESHLRDFQKIISSLELK
jgi:hypothetical protein